MARTAFSGFAAWQTVVSVCISCIDHRLCYSKKVAWHKIVAYWRGSGICIGAYSSKHDVYRWGCDRVLCSYHKHIVCCAVRHYDSTFKACSKEKQGAFDGHNMRYCDCGAGCQYGCDRTWMYRQKQLQCQCGRYAKGTGAGKRGCSWQRCTILQGWGYRPTY